VPAPLLAVSSTSQSFTATQSIGTAPGQIVTISNAGRGSITGLQVSVLYNSGSGWLNANLSSTAAPATLTLTPAANTLARGTYSATVRVSASGVAGSPKDITVSYALIYTFDQHIAGGFTGSCAGSFCHSQGNSSGLPAFTGTPNAYTNVMAYVSPGNPTASYIWQRLNGNPSYMPPSGLNAALRDAVGFWITDGAKKN